MHRETGIFRLSEFPSRGHVPRSPALRVRCALVSNALHDWNLPTVKRLLEKSFAALPPGGLVVVNDKHLNREKTGPLRVAAFSVLIMSATEGRAYSITEIEERLLAAGFVAVDYREVILDYSIITARKP